MPPSIASPCAPLRSWPAAALALLLISLPAWAGKAHEHGVARLDIAVDGAQVTVALQAALDGLVGFERAPRTDAERATVAGAVARLRDPAALFRFEPAAGCRVDGAPTLSSRSLGLGPAAAAAPASDGHDDLDGEFRFRCERAPAWLDSGLVAAFPRLKRIDVQTAAASGQSQATLRAGAAQRIALAK